MLFVTSLILAEMCSHCPFTYCAKFWFTMTKVQFMIIMKWFVIQMFVHILLFFFLIQQDLSLTWIKKKKKSMDNKSYSGPCAVRLPKACVIRLTCWWGSKGRNCCSECARVLVNSFEMLQKCILSNLCQICVPKKGLKDFLHNIYGKSAELKRLLWPVCGPSQCS